jgi:hypothetical protein
MRLLVPFLLSLAAGCGGPTFPHPLAASPLLAAEWPDPFGGGPISAGGDARSDDAQDEDESEDEDEDESEDEGEGGGDVRERMIAAARRWLADGAERPERGFGARDLDAILDEAIPRLSWSAADGLDALVAAAKKGGAYRASGRPRAGDVALFHNQYDADADGAADDWLTGCGVIVETDGPRFTAITRTGHAPRAIVAWPDGPAVERLDGDKVNSYLRIPSRSDPKDAEYLAGDLFAGYLDVGALEASAGER